MAGRARAGKGGLGQPVSGLSVPLLPPGGAGAVPEPGIGTPFLRISFLLWVDPSLGKSCSSCPAWSRPDPS